ncbi:hypothetical protein SDC9_101793 [bioreactor metagenome]|uniref:Uncharacterized protein n=1 Tax=bioreactor metagenome TaxID=1076179 RepID=A0A645AQG6_9ZZZZ
MIRLAAFPVKMPEIEDGYSKTDLRNIEPLLVILGSTVSVNPTVISFSMFRILVFKAFPLKFSSIIAMSISSENRLINLYPLDKDVPPLKTVLSE